jgi:hypothetical protein
MRKTTIVTDCGHQYRTGWCAADVAGCTTDCRVCGALLIFPYETTRPTFTVVRGRAFHAYLHETWPAWPADGVGTAYVEFGVNA